MTDYFALFGERRQPWLDPETLKQKYHRFARAVHPDVTANAAGTAFEAINAAYGVLSDPKQRVQHLLALERSEPLMGETALSEELQEFFLRIAALAQKARALPEQMQAATAALHRSLLQKQAEQLARELNETLRAVQAAYNGSLRELEQMNVLWNADKGPALQELKTLYASISYLTRWLAELKEMQVQLTVGRGD
jgi:curved DNA-binding protein CbpA